jgi:xylulokinase
MSGLFLGVDLGTSGLKAAALRADGEVVAQAEAGYALARSTPGQAQIAAQDWEAALQTALLRLGDMRFDSVGIAGQMHGLVLVDDKGLPCRPAVLWPDRRAQSELTSWHELSTAQRLRLANPILAGMAGPLLKWVQRHEPDTYQRARLALQPKDYLRSRLGGALVSERSDASATLLWDVPADTWAWDVVEDLGLDAQLLPEIVAPHWVVGEARLPGAPALVAGAGDTPAALLGAGGLGPGEVQINLGTGAQILIGIEAPEPLPDPAWHLYADAQDGWYGMVGLQNAGLALNKAREWLSVGWPDFFSLAASAPAGAGGVSVLPFLTGERGGVAAPDSRGAWLGLSEMTTPSYLARAAIEGMLFAVRRGVELLAGKPDRVRVSGGGVREEFVAQMLADVLGSQVQVIPERSASAVGAAMLAATGVGATLPTPEIAALSFVPQASMQGAYDLWLSRLEAARL